MTLKTIRINEKILEWLKHTRIPLTEISDKTGLSRSTLYNWLEGKPIRERNGKKFLKIYNKDIRLTNTEIQLEGDGEVDAQYVIELQKEKIEHLNDEIDHLKTTLKEKHAEATHWDALLYDYTSVCTISRKGLRYGRMVNAVDNLEIQSKILGYTKSELNAFWDVGTQYDDFFTHPSDKLYDQETLKDMRRQLSTLPHIFNSLKSMVGDHYIPQPLLFICKDGSLKGAVAYCKVQWWDMIINAKVQFCRD